jgi:small ligand-binding sensory domain FIST
MYDDRTHDNIVKQLKSIDESNKIHGVGIIAGNIVGNRVADVKAQTKRPIEMKLVAGATQAVISELSEIAENSNMFSMSPKEKQASFREAINMLDQIGSGGRQNG